MIPTAPVTSTSANRRKTDGIIGRKTISTGMGLFGIDVVKDNDLAIKCVVVITLALIFFQFMEDIFTAWVNHRYRMTHPN